jgi:hypothetical protein
MDRSGCALEEEEAGDFEKFLDPARRRRGAAGRVAYDSFV